MNKKKPKPIDSSAKLDDYRKYVQQYRRASLVLDNEDHILWPKIQIRGHLIELSLKTYLCAAGFEWEIHDLKKLAKFAEEKGLVLTRKDYDEIINSINELYFKLWDERHLCRYPLANRPMLVSVTPGHNNIDEMIQRIMDQEQNKYNV